MNHSAKSSSSKAEKIKSSLGNLVRVSDDNNRHGKAHADHMKSTFTNMMKEFEEGFKAAVDAVDSKDVKEVLEASRDELKSKYIDEKVVPELKEEVKSARNEESEKAANGNGNKVVAEALRQVDEAVNQKSVQIG